MTLTAQGQGKQRWGRSGVFPAAEAPPPGTPGWGGVIPAGAEVGDSLPPMPTSMPKDLEPSPLCQSAWIQWHTWHVEMPTWWREHLKIPGHNDCQEFACKVCASFEVPKVCNWAKGWIMITPSASTSVNREVSFYAVLRCKVWQSGLLTLPITPDPHLHEGTSVLGGEGPTTSSWSTSLSGRKCGGTPSGNGASGLLYRGGSHCGHCTLQLGGGELAQADRIHPMRSPIGTTAEDTGPPKGVSVSGQWQRPTHHHWEDRCACCSSLGEDAAAVWPQAPIPSAQVCRNHMSPVGGGISGEWSNISHQHPAQRSQGTIWGDGILCISNPTVLASHLRGNVHQYADLHAECSGPGAQPHGRWLPGSSSVGAPQLRLILCFTA